MTQTRPERPLLATLICIWEVAVVFIEIVGLIWQHHFHRLHPLLQHRSVPLPLLHTISVWITYCLAIAAAISLWQMHRSSFVLLAARFGIGLLWFLIGLPYLASQHWPSIPAGTRLAIDMIVIRWGNYLFIVIGLVFGASLACYAYAITKPPFARSAESKSIA